MVALVVRVAHIDSEPVYIVVPQGEPTVRFVLNNYGGDIEEVLKAGTGRAKDIIDVLRARRSGPYKV